MRKGVKKKDEIEKRGFEKEKQRENGHGSWTTNMDAVLLGGVGVINFNLIF